MTDSLARSSFARPEGDWSIISQRRSGEGDRHRHMGRANIAQHIRTKPTCPPTNHTSLTIAWPIRTIAPLAPPPPTPSKNMICDRNRYVRNGGPGPAGLQVFYSPGMSASPDRNESLPRLMPVHGRSGSGGFSMVCRMIGINPWGPRGSTVLYSCGDRPAPPHESPGPASQTCGGGLGRGVCCCCPTLEKTSPTCFWDFFCFRIGGGGLFATGSWPARGQGPGPRRLVRQDRGFRDGARPAMRSCWGYSCRPPSAFSLSQGQGRGPT